MNSFKIPLDLSSGNIYKNNISTNKNELNKEQMAVESIKNFIKLLLYSASGSFKPDYDFGFSLNNFKFENVNNPTNSCDTLNNKKIKDYNVDLEKTISKFETRLKDIRIKIELNTSKAEIIVSLKAKYLDNSDFNEIFTFYIWKEK